MQDHVKECEMYFKTRPNEEVRENTLCELFEITPSEARVLIADVRYKLPIINAGTRKYMFSTDPKKLEEYIARVEAQLRERAIKKNIARRYLKECQQMTLKNIIG